MSTFDILLGRQNLRLENWSTKAIERLAAGQSADDIEPGEFSGNARGTAQMLRRWREVALEQRAHLARELAVVAAFGRSFAVIEFDMKGKVVDANENFLEGAGLHARRDQAAAPRHVLSITAYRDSP
jgi:hypothetical protein